MIGAGRRGRWPSRAAGVALGLFPRVSSSARYGRWPSRAAGAALLGAVVAAGAPSEVAASGLSLPLVGRAGSSVVGGGASSTWHNPGWLPFVGPVTVEASGGLVWGRASYERERRGVYQYEDSFAFQLPVSPFDIDPDKRGFAPEVRANPLAPVGSFFVAGSAGVVGWGFGLFAPWGAVLELPDDGAQRWALQEASILAVHATPAVGIRLGDRVGLGVGASLVIGHAGLRRVQDFAEIEELGGALARPPISQPNAFGANAPVAVRELDVLGRPVSLTDAWGVRGTFHVGLSAQLSERARVGLVWQHGVDMQWEGDVVLDMDDDFFVRDLVSEGLAWEPRVRGRGTLGVPLPSALRGGVALRVNEAWTVEPTLSWVRWSSVRSYDVRIASDGLAMPALGLPSTQSLRIDRRWRDVVETAWTGRRRFEQGELVLGLGYHSPASPDRTVDIGSIDGHRLVASAGGVWQRGRQWQIGGSFEVQSILPRRVVGSAHDRGNGRYGLLLAGLTLDLSWSASERSAAR